MANFEKEAKIQAWVFGFPLLCGIPALLLPIFGIQGFVCYLLLIVGGWFVLLAKINSKLRNRILIEWGPQRMIQREKYRYVIGYGMIFSSVLVPLIFKL